MNALLLLLLLIIPACTSCQPTPAPSPPPPAPTPVLVDSGPPADVYDAACRNLARLGCQDGTDPHCHAVLEQVVATDLTPVNVPCLETATTVAAARACGFATCPGQQ